ncbi:MAG: hypothetical protein ANABAC_1330 [Anaerolineae bacterium]|nr:MAG: hypothetical protein ANABAC_1330 [Anaerolineae bacterium]
MARLFPFAVKPKLIATILVLLLAACSEPKAAPSTQDDDPISLQATADALMLSAKSIAKSAQEAEKRIKATEKAYNLQSTRQAQSITATAQAVFVKATEQAGQATATAQALSIQATSTAQSLALAQGQRQATATAQAIIALETSRAEEQKRIEIAATARLYAGVVLLAGVVIILLGLLWYAGQYYLDVIIQRHQLVESRAGTLLLQPVGYRPVRVTVLTPQLPAATSEKEGDEFTSQLEDIPYLVNGDLKGFIPRRNLQEADDNVRKLVLRLLREAMNTVGAQSTRLPGWREMGWAAETWSNAIDYLRPYLETQSGRGGGTYLRGEYRTLRDLYLAVGERRIHLVSPTPIEMIKNL